MTKGDVGYLVMDVAGSDSTLAFEKLQGVQLLFEDFVLTEKGKKVFLKSYILRAYPDDLGGEDNSTTL